MQWICILQWKCELALASNLLFVSHKDCRHGSTSCLFVVPSASKKSSVVSFLFSCFARSAGIYFLQNVLCMYVNNLGRFASCGDPKQQPEDCNICMVLYAPRDWTCGSWVILKYSEWNVSRPRWPIEWSRCQMASWKVRQMELLLSVWWLDSLQQLRLSHRYNLYP